MTDRALAPVVGKSLEIVIVILYVATLVTTLHGGVVPDYRTASASELSDRTLASTADRIETGVPPRGTAVDATIRIDLPATIDREPYRITVDDGVLVLDHPDDALSGRLGLTLPSRVVIDGTWESGDRAVLRIWGTAERVRVILA